MGDHPATRKISGLAYTSAKIFCAHCNMNLDIIWDLEKESWEKKDDRTLKEKAIVWKNEPNFSQRETTFKKYGVKYSSLHQLP